MVHFLSESLNLAKGKPTAQSSTDDVGYSSKAVDGCNETNFRHSGCGCTLTKAEGILGFKDLAYILLLGCFSQTF